MLAAGLVLGLGGRKTIQRYLEDKDAGSREETEKAVWKHL